MHFRWEHGYTGSRPAVRANRKVILLNDLNSESLEAALGPLAAKL